MFKLLRVAFLTIVRTYRPVFEQPERLYRLVLGPVLIALFSIYVVVPFAPLLISLVSEPTLTVSGSIVGRVVGRLPIIAIDMIAILPWLWLASVLMMKWPHVRRTAGPEPRPSIIGLQRRIWRSTALMFGMWIVAALLFETYLQTAEYFDELSDSYTHYANYDGGSVGVVRVLIPIFLARYGLVLHGLAIGSPMSFRESRQRLTGRSYRLFWSFLTVIWVGAYAPTPTDGRWFSSTLPAVHTGNAEMPTNSLLETDTWLIVSVFLYAFTVCAVSELIARTYTATETIVPEAQGQPIPAQT